MRIYLIGKQIVYMHLGVNVMLTVDLCCQLTFLDLSMLNSLTQSPAQFLKMMILHISSTVFQGTLPTVDQLITSYINTTIQIVLQMLTLE